MPSLWRAWLKRRSSRNLVINYALGHLPASIVSPTLLGQPVVTALLAGLLLGEVLSAWHIAGGVAVLAGVLLVHRSRRAR